MWAAQLGWLHSAPQRKNKDDQRTRMEQYGDDHPYTAMPELDQFEYMGGLFIKSGMVTRGMNGASPITWSEIRAYNEANMLGLNAWENEQLMEMSRSYCRWQAKGSAQNEIADDVPYIDDSRSVTGYLTRQRDASAKKAKNTKTRGRIE